MNSYNFFKSSELESLQIHSLHAYILNKDLKVNFIQ